MGMKKITVFDILLIVMAALGAVVVSPFVLRQFSVLSKAGDILWNAAFDLLLLTAVILFGVFLSKLLAKFDRWA